MGDQADLRCVSLPGAEPPGSAFTLTSRGIEELVGGLLPATGGRVSSPHIMEKRLRQARDLKREMSLDCVLLALLFCEWLVGKAAPADKLS